METDGDDPPEARRIDPGSEDRSAATPTRPTAAQASDALQQPLVVTRRSPARPAIASPRFAGIVSTLEPWAGATAFDGGALDGQQLTSGVTLPLASPSSVALYRLRRLP